MLIAQIIGVLSLYHCTKYHLPTVYANIKNINFHIFKCKIHFYEEKCMYLPYENTWVKLGLAFGNRHVYHT